MSANTKQFPLKSVEEASFPEEEMNEKPARAKSPGSARSPRPVQGGSEEDSVFHVAVQVREEDLASWSPERLSTFFEAVNVLLMAKTHANIPLKRLGGLQYAEAGHGQADLQDFETRMANRLKEHEGILAEMQRSSSGTLDALRTELAMARQRAMDPAPASSSRALNHIGDGLDAVEDRIKRIEATVDGVRRHIATLHESIAADFKDFESNLASHNAAILSARSAMSQTDDLVERVVEALEVLQTSTIPSPEDAANAPVN